MNSLSLRGVRALAIRGACALAFVGLILVSGSNATAQRLYQLTKNPNFDYGVGGWNIRKAGADPVVRDWTPGFSPGQFEQRLGRNLVLIKDEGCFGQTFRIPDGNRYQLLNAHAYKFAEDHRGDGGYAAIAVSYYDKDWKEIDKFVIDIEGRNKSLNRGIADGMNFYSYGAFVPEGAVYAFMFVYVEKGTCVYLDGFGLYDYRLFDRTPETPNLLINPTFHVGASYAFGYNTEFWHNVLDPAKGQEFFGELGSVNQPESVYQFVDMSPNCTYTLTVEGIGTESTPASVGLDFYDAHWNRIGKRIINMTGRDYVFDGARVIPPQGTAHTSVFAYTDQTVDTDERMSIFRISLQKQDDRLSYQMSAIVNRVGTFRDSNGVLRRFVRVIYNDADGVNLHSIDKEDVFFSSKSDPNKVYEASKVGVIAANGNRVVYATYIIGAAPGELSDVGDIFYCPNQVSDINGEFLPATH